MRKEKTLDWLGFIGPDYSDWYMSDTEAALAGITEQACRAALNELEPSTDLVVNLSSEGGYADVGVGIMNLLRMDADKRRKTDPDYATTVNVIGTAYSAASIICCGFDKCIMHLGTEMMIHRASTFAWGNSEEMKACATRLDGVDDRIVSIFVAKTGKSSEEIKKLLVNETFLSPGEAVDLGLASATNEVSARYSPPIRDKAFNYHKWVTEKAFNRSGRKPCNKSVAWSPSPILTRLELELTNGSDCP